MTHLTESELCDLLEAKDTTQPASAAHLAACLQCRAELNMLRESISLLHEATTAYAVQHAPNAHSVRFEVQTQPFFSFRPTLVSWSAAAVALVVAVALGLTTLHQHAAPLTGAVTSFEPGPSDEALLQSISDDIDQPVPVSLRILAGPSRSQPTSEAHPERTN